MEAVFLKLLNMSITAGWLVLAVVAFRFVFKKAPKALHVMLWALVCVRLICPFSFESVLSLVPSAETVPQDIMYSDAPAIHTGIPMMNSTINPIISESLAPNVGDSVNPMQVIVAVASYVWILGMIAMVLYTFFSYHSVHKKVREAVPIREKVWMCDHVDTPFILGVFRPQIYLPSNMSEEDVTYVLAHENAHLKRHDHWWKPLGFALLTVYWFNPLLWLAYVLLCRDIELACDEKVIKELGVENKKPYSEALINCSIPRKMITACPLAFGEVGVKARVKTVLNYKKPAFWIILLAVVACVIVAVCFLTNPKDDGDKPYVLKSGEYAATSSVNGQYPYFILDTTKKEFRMSGGIAVSAALFGTYEFDGSKLSLTVGGNEENAEVYVLYLKQNGNFVYDEEASTFIHENPWLKDGMVFKKTKEFDDASSNKSQDNIIWFDFFKNPEANREEVLKKTLLEFLDVTFNYQSGKVTISNEKGVIKEICGGMAEFCHSAYFYDLTGDKKPELCMNVSVGSGMIDARVVVYDIAKDVIYQLEDRGNYDYVLCLADGELIVNKTKYFSDYLVERGGLAIRKNSDTDKMELVIVPTEIYKENYVLRSGSYEAGVNEAQPPTSSIGVLWPYFYLNTTTKEVRICENMLMSFARFGTYEFDGSKLTHTIGVDEKTADVYVLYLNQYGGFVYDEASSTLISDKQWFKDGMVFGRKTDVKDLWDGVYRTEWLMMHSNNGEGPISNFSDSYISGMLEILNTGTWKEDNSARDNKCKELFYIEGSDFRIAYCDCGIITDTTNRCYKVLSDAENLVFYNLYVNQYNDEDNWEDESRYNIDFGDIVTIDGNKVTVIMSNNTKETFLIADVKGLSVGDNIMIQYNVYSAGNTKIARVIER